MMLKTDSARFDGTDRQWTVPLVAMGGLPIAAIGRDQSAQFMVDVALARRGGAKPPLIVTSANGQVISQCDRDSRVRELFLAADLIHADGMPMVLVSRLFRNSLLRERVCTTDLFQDVAAVAQERGARIFLLGATDKVVTEAAKRTQKRYPDLKLVGCAGGYFRSDMHETRTIDAINAAQPDILFLGLGAPLEQEFAMRNRERLCGVGLIKTAGGLFDYVCGKNARAPVWMQNIGMEWAYRTYLEPRRLAGRYLMTNPHALFLLLTRSGTASHAAGKRQAAS
jgi:exopolysaccharide biosynthesis WecB/TagA/CpsF family protein